MGAASPAVSREAEPTAQDTEAPAQASAADAALPPVARDAEPRAGDDDTSQRPRDGAASDRPPPASDVQGGPITAGLALMVDTRAVFWKAAWLFFPMGLLPQIPLLFAGDFQPEDLTTRYLVLLIFAVLLHVVATGSMILAVAHIRVYGGVRLGKCLSDAAQVALPLLVVYLIVGFTLFSCIILIALLIGLPLLLYFLVTLFFAPHVVAIERLNPLMALGKSRWLVRGYIVTAFVIGVMFVTPFLVATLVVFVPFALLASDSAMAVNVVVAGLSAAATSYLTIGGTLTYLHLRGKREDYDLELLKAEIEQG